MGLLMRVAFVLLFAKFGQTLYEDQINKYDWKKEYIGKIKDVVYDSSLSISKNLYVATEKNVIASLSSKNGQLNWRQILEDKIEKIVQYNDGVLTVTSSGIVRVWDPATGLLKWDTNIAYELKDSGGENFDFVDFALMELTYTEGSLIVILSTNGLYTIRVKSASKLKVNFVDLKDVQRNSKLYVDSEQKHILILNEGLSVSAAFYDATTLEPVSQKNIQTAWLDDAKNVVVLEDNILVYASKSMEAFYIIDLRKGTEIATEPFSALDISEEISSLNTMKSKDVLSIGKDVFAISRSGEVVHLRFNDDNSLSVVNRFPSSKGAVEFCQIDIKRVGSEKYYFVSVVDDKKLKVRGFDLKSSKEESSLVTEYPLAPDIGGVEKVHVNMYLKRTSPVGYRVLFTTRDDSAMMVTQPTRLAWHREEALASIVAAEMLDLPLSDIEAGIEVEFEQAEKHSIVEMFVNRIRAQAGQVRSFAKQFTKAIKEGTLFEKKTKDPLVQDESMTRDPFSLHKMLVLVTEPGKLFGIDSLSGEIIWRLFNSKMSDKNLKLFIQRTTAHFPNPPSALLFASEKTGSSNAVSIMNFNPITGEESKGQGKISFNGIIQVMLLPFPDSAYLRPLLLLDENRNIQLIPDTADVRSKLHSAKNSVFLYSVDKESGKISGYRFGNSEKLMEKTWSVNIPSDQSIVLVKGKEFFERIDSMGRPLADRSVIYKYLNPNLVAIFTVSIDESDQNSAVTLYLIDAVSGHMIHTLVQKKSTGPIHAVHSENWLIYSYWNTKGRRTEIASIELYEGKQLRNDSFFSSFDHQYSNPLVISQAYIVGATIKAMGVSKTERGLTTRQILIGLARGGILGLPRRVFDPRRPLQADQSHREEGLMPYVPDIQVHPAMLVNYNKTIHGITNIYSCPSALESTSIVLVTGLDLFFTRTQPSKMFDVLKEDFEYAFIAAVVLGMFIAALVTRKLAQNKKLKKAWK
uniref:ER membrane protein complex subunit 1-like n=1 Tax=Styela clava TaxID=7725 RepID=UPI001939C81D|nr:ER membrane protein complex subunit 1-like [Styela clava]